MNPDIDFYSVHIPIRRDTFPKTLQLVNKLGYDYQTAFSKEDDLIVRKKLNFPGYPRLFIVKNGRLKYQGQLVTEKYVFVHSLENEIKRLLK